jgi:hypothetical protein
MKPKTYKKYRIFFLWLFVTMMSGACIQSGNCPSDWDCDYYDDCPNGKTIYTCVNRSVTSGGYRVGDICYQCEDILDASGCDSAAENAEMVCYSSFSATPESNINEQEQEEIIDPYTYSENSEADLINEKLIFLRETIEKFKK